MARALITALGLLAGVALSMPAAAQFGGIFNDSPRPPGEIPGGRTLPPPDPYATPQGRLPPGPPPGRPNVQRQELPPPPGVARRVEPWIPPDQRPLPGQQPPGAPGDTLQGEPLPPLDPGQVDPGQLQQGQQQPGQPPQTDQQRQASLPPSNEVVITPPEDKIINPVAVFSGLDKITGRITEFQVKINETVRFGALEVTPRACYTRPPTETQITDGFIEVDELTLEGELKRIFTGWMFVASPGLNAVEHPIYDVWLKDCKGEEDDKPTVAERADGEPPVETTRDVTPVPRRRPADL